MLEDTESIGDDVYLKYNGIHNLQNDSIQRSLRNMFACFRGLVESWVQILKLGQFWAKQNNLNKRFDYSEHNQVSYT